MMSTEGAGYLTTHVLDTAHGRPAQNMAIALFRLEENDRKLVTMTVTNDDGRTERPLLSPGEMAKGLYELVFEVGAYFDDQDDGPAEPFLDVVPIRFSISDEAAHYHVPLLVSPYSYSTYRGS